MSWLCADVEAKIKTIEDKIKTKRPLKKVELELMKNEVKN